MPDVVVRVRTFIVHQPIAPCRFPVLRGEDIVYRQSETFARNELVGVPAISRVEAQAGVDGLVSTR